LTTQKKQQRPLHAYKNLAFLNSKDARAIRILSEFLEPLSRFNYFGVKDIIVFFGSARIQSPADANKRLREAATKLRKKKEKNFERSEEYRKAKMAVDMSAYYKDAAELSFLLTKWSRSLKEKGRFVVCTGGGPGIMEAANRGATQAKGRSIGLNIGLPFEQFPNPYISPELSFEFHYFFMRKYWFMYLGKALVAFPGGFGTLDELMELLTLLQTKKIKKKMTVILYGKKYWEHVINFSYLEEYGMVGKEDFDLFKFADSPNEAFKFLKEGLNKNYPNDSI
jgi:uncharacterized protein (TIGR00730 family)